MITDSGVRAPRLAPTDAILAVNHRCNTFCAMCDIWSKPERGELPPEFYRRVPKSLKNINISGGEPFMRDDLPEIIAVLRETLDNPRFIFSTNGMLTDKIVRQAVEMSPVAIRVSVDGVGATHDKIRNVKGCFERVMGTVKQLQAAGIKDLGLACTGSKDNPGALGEVKKLAESIGVDFVCSVVHSSEVYFGEQGDMVPRDAATRGDLVDIATRQLRSLRPKDWFRAYYTDGIIDYIDGKRRREACTAATRHIYVSHKGVVYPCNILNRVLGDLTKMTWDEIEAAQNVPGVLADVKNCSIQCWMSCTVAPGMKSHPLVPAAWIAKRWISGATPRPSRDS